MRPLERQTPWGNNVGSNVYDLLVIGGGINGTGIARDAAGRGYSVLLAEMEDLASGTSSRSTKLIHGGLRYLEHFAFRLVREALAEREVLWATAPHIVRPLRFVLPHRKGLRPAWMLRLGLLLYDTMGGRKRLPPTRRVDLKSDPLGRHLKDGISIGFEYSDCWVDDARLVVLNALDAVERGAEVRTRTRVTGARPENGLWKITLTDAVTAHVESVEARMIVNAAGPWLSEVPLAGPHGRPRVRLVKGSHIVVPRLYDDPRCFILQNRDGRIVFTIPYEGFTLIGTTDEDFAGDPRTVAINAAEIDYLCKSVSEYFATPVSPESVVSTYSGVRSLYDDGASKAQEATRDFVLEYVGETPPMLNVIGGKITTYRELAEKAMLHVGEALGVRGAAWTEAARLPGGDFEMGTMDAQIAELEERYPFLPEGSAAALMARYGLRAYDLLGDAETVEDLGAAFGAGLFACEVDYLVAEEWALTVEDILWRRTKLGLRSAEIDIDALQAHIKAKTPEGGTWPAT